MFKSLWAFLKSEENRKTVGWIIGGICAVVVFLVSIGILPEANDIRRKLQNDPDKNPSESQALEEKSPLDGSWFGVLSYTDDGRPRSQCRGLYRINADVKEGTIVFLHQGVTWRGSINSSGAISIQNDSTPPSKHEMVIYGPIENATLYNGYCGNGFVKLHRRDLGEK